MMLLSDISTKGYDSFENAGYRVPKYNRKKMVTKTMESPFWIHFGAGNIFRAFQANVIEQLLNKGVLDRGLIVAEGYDYEIIDKIYHPYDNHSILVTFRKSFSFFQTAGSFPKRFPTNCKLYHYRERLSALSAEWFLSQRRNGRHHIRSRPYNQLYGKSCFPTPYPLSCR